MTLLWLDSRMRLGRLTRALCVGAALAVFSIAAFAQGGNPPAAVVSLLTNIGGFGSGDLSDLQAGRVITRTDETPEVLEGSVVTAVRIATTKERALDYLRLLVSYVDGQVTLAYGTFSRPPAEADV